MVAGSSSCRRTSRPPQYGQESFWRVASLRHRLRDRAGLAHTPAARAAGRLPRRRRRSARRSAVPPASIPSSACACADGPSGSRRAGIRARRPACASRDRTRSVISPSPTRPPAASVAATFRPSSRAGLDRGPEDVPRGDVRNAVALRDSNGLRALSRPGRSDENDVDARVSGGARGGVAWSWMREAGQPGLNRIPCFPVRRKPTAGVSGVGMSRYAGAWREGSDPDGRARWPAAREHLILTREPLLVPEKGSPPRSAASCGRTAAPAA